MAIDRCTGMITCYPFMIQFRLISRPELNLRVTVTGDEPLAGYCGVDELISKFPLKTNQINSYYGHYFQ